MKILLSGYHNPHFWTITEYIEHAILELNHSLVSFDDRQHLLPGRIRKRYALFNRLSLAYINHCLVKKVIKSRPQVIIVTGGQRISAKGLKAIGAKAKLALWTTDAPHDFGNIMKTAPLYDRVFCQGSEAVELLEKKGVNAMLLPMACYPKWHRPITLTADDRAKYGCNLAFVGSYYPSRLQALECIADRNISVWGPGWGKIPKDSPLRAAIHDQPVKMQEWVKIYSACKMVLCPHYRDLQGEMEVHQISPKLFEALACKCFVLTDQQRDVSRFFIDEVHLCIYSDLEELKEKVDYFLSYNEERVKIARQGYNEARSKHTYVDRVSQLLSLI